MEEEGEGVPEMSKGLLQRFTEKAVFLVGAEFVSYLREKYGKELPSEEITQNSFMTGFSLLLVERAQKISKQQGLSLERSLEMAVEKGEKKVNYRCRCMILTLTMAS